VTAERLTVVHVLEALEGGTARHLCDVATHVTGARHVVVIPDRRVGGLTDETARGRLEAAGAEVRVLGMRRTPWSPANASALLALRRLLLDVEPDVVHGHSSIGGLLARLAVRGHGPPAVYTANGITRVRVGVAVERALRRWTAAFVATSASEGRLAAEQHLADADRIVVIPNGIELDPPASPVDLRSTYGIPAGAPLVGSIARLVWQKAPEDLAAAFAAVARRRPDARFVVIGGGELEREFEAAVDAHGLRGQLTRIDQLPGAGGVLDQLDVFVLASRFEGGPYAPLEAMRAGTPVVLTDVVGSRDAVEDGVSGRLVAPGDPRALGDAVADLLDDPVERARLGAAGRARVEADFDLRRMATALEQVYRLVVEQGAPESLGPGAQH
jgi:glycosyltransferase involved in cell wall biosynthesis